MKAMSWEVFQSVFSGTAYGNFRIAFGPSVITIHTLDQSKPHEYVAQYAKKVEDVIEALRGFSPVLGTKNHASYRAWLNPQESGATGSVAYHYDVQSDETLIYFELASCDSKIRIYPHQFPKPQLRNMQRCLDSIRDELVHHLEAFLNLQKAIEAESVKLVEILKEVD